MSNELNDNFINSLKTFACELADSAAEVTLKYFKTSIGIDDKDEGSGFDPVTKADREAEAAIRALIEEHYPDHNICGEEYGIKKTNSPFEWVLDPIDGTRAFICGAPCWGTLIALKYNGEPIIGVIDQPYIKERYLGWPGGASLNGKPIKTRSCKILSDATISTTEPDLFNKIEREGFERLKKETKLIRYSLDCYAYALLSAGHLDIVIETGLQPYDMMALIPVINGAGGIALNWEQKPAGGGCGRIIAFGDKDLVNETMALL